MILSVFTIVPFSVTAADIQQSVGAASGTTGDCTWTITDDGVLTISGNGSMGNYDYYNIAPWRSYNAMEVIIEDGVKSIGNRAFYQCSSLANVSIPDSVDGIGSYAFCGCTDLVSVDIPDSVYDIGYAAFAECTSLSNIVIPDSVKGIYEGLFWGCTNLSDVTLSSSLVSIGNSVFRECRSLKNITIPDTVTQIGQYAFYNCSALTSINLSDSITRIDRAAFEFCTSLKEITLPDSVTTTGEQVFHGCNNLESVIIGNSLRYINEYMFLECSSLKSIDIPKSVEKICRDAFSSCTNLTSVVIPNSVTSIGDTAFARCTSLESVIIPNSVKSIEDNAFYNCTSLTIYSYAGSTAETYAQENGFNFVPLTSFNGHSLSLNGDIGVNFYTSFEERYITEGAEVSFSWTAGGKEKSETVVLTAEDKTANGYKATCHVAPAEITSEITATLTLGGQAVLTDTYSVKQYADEILNNEANYDNNLISLVKAMLDYGTRAQIKFNCDADHPANGGNYTFTEPVNPAGITSTMSDMTANLSNYGLEYTGSTVVLLTETSIRHYYKIIDSDKFEAVKDNITFNEAKVGYTVKGGEIYFELKNISAPDIDTPYTLHIGDNDYHYAVTDYIKSYLTNGKNNETKALAAAMYYYNQAANDYFG